MIEIISPDGTVETVALPLPEQRERLRQLVEARAAACFARGYSPAVGPLAGHTLQVRDAEDRTNWLTSQAAYQAAVMAGHGDVVNASFRTAANATITLTYAEGLSVLVEGMATWGQAILARSWELKDAVADAPDTAALAAIAAQIDQGWP